MAQRAADGYFLLVNSFATSRAHSMKRGVHANKKMSGARFSRQRDVTG
jgi:hypothetical protein